MVEFTATDNAGTDHRYEVNNIPLREAARFARHVLAKAARPLATLLSTVDSAEAKALSATPAEGDDGALLDAFNGLDIEMLAGELGEVIETLDIDAILDMFKHVRRDGVPMDTDEALQRAYDRNWVELYTAVFELIRSQGFLAFFATSSKT